MYRIMLLHCLSCLALLGHVLAVDQVRGVPPSKLQAYQSVNGQFECLDHSKRIPYERLNDDYCDCPDGSDEPGTSACVGGTFFCQNAGHIPVYLPSNRVNDGVCEESCCDGSDEWLGLTKCPNTCRQKAKEYTEIQGKKEAIRQSGWKIKQEWQKTAHKLRMAITDEVQRTQAQVDSMRINLMDKEASLEKLESESAAMGAAATSQDEADTILARYQGAIKVLQDKIVEQQNRIAQLETIMKDVSEGYNPNYQDMAVKGAVTSFNALTPMTQSGLSDQDMQELDQITIVMPRAQTSTSLPPSSSLSGFWNHYRTKLVDIGLLQRASTVSSSSSSSSSSQAPFESKQLLDAKASTERMREELVTTERELNNLKSSLEENFGENDVYRAVKGQCFSALISDYTYEVCLLQTLHQKSPSASTLVGNFDHVDEQGSLVYRHGQKCWNGPERSGRVDLECGAVNELLSVREAQKCEYVFRVRSPLACSGPPAPLSSGRDEL